MSPRVLAPLCALAGLLGCARPAEVRAPPQPAPRPVAVAEPPAEPPADEVIVAEPAGERTGKHVLYAPPEPQPHDDVDVWGDLHGQPPDDRAGLGCPRGVEPPPPSYVRGGRRSLVRLRSAGGASSGALTGRLLAGRAANLRDCHVLAMEAEPTAAGSLRLRLEVGANGGVLAVAVETTELAAIDDCVRATALRWRFPPADEGATLTAEFELRTEAAPAERPMKPRCRR